MIYVQHCGHPTALWPWGLYVDGELIAAPNGTAFRTKAHATAAAAAVELGTVVPFERPQYGRDHGYPRVLIAADDQQTENWTSREVCRAWEAMGVDLWESMGAKV